MPHIHRIRIANVHYDKGTRLISDITFEPENDNVIVIMPNGEGKTTIIQLIIQAILPHQKLQGRDLVETLLPGSTGHVVIEWKMDGDDERYVGTGFCFHYDKSKKLHSFNYTFDYIPMLSLFNDEEESVNITTLPFVIENRPIGYQNLRDWLREKDIYPIDEIKKYKEKIRDYSLVPEEWESIAAMNNDEAGASGVFEKAKSTKNLLENMLIPEIEKMIYTTDEKLNKIITIFYQHQEILLNLPIQKKNIEDFGIFVSESESLLTEIKGYDEEKKVLEDRIDAFRRLFLLFQQKNKESQELSEVEINNIKLGQDKIDDYKWKMDSYDVYVKQVETKHQEKEEQKELEKLCQDTELLNRVKLQMSTLKSYESLQQIKIQDKEIVALNEQISTLDLQEPELIARLTSVQRSMKASWDFNYELLTGDIQQKKNLSTEKKQASEQFKVLIQEKNSQKDNLLQNVTELRLWLEETERQKQYITETIDSDASEWPNEALVKANENSAEWNQLLESQKALKTSLEEDRNQELQNTQTEKELQLNEELIKERTYLMSLSTRLDEAKEAAEKKNETAKSSQTIRANLLMDTARNRGELELNNCRLQHKEKVEALSEQSFKTIEKKRNEKDNFIVSLSNELEIKLRTIGKEHENHRTNINNLDSQYKIIENELEGVNIYLSQQNAKLSEMMLLGIDTEHIYTNQIQSMHSHYTELSDSEERLNLIRSQLKTSRVKLSQLEENDFIIPSADLLTVINVLRDHGLSAVLGSEWIANQEMTEKEKENILSQLPLLPFSILVRSHEMAPAAVALASMGEWFNEIPVLLMNSESLSTVSSIGNPNGLIEVNEGLFVFYGKSAEIYISPEFIVKMREDMSLKINELTSEEQLLIQFILFQKSLIKALELYYEQFPEEKVVSFQNKSNDFPTQMLKLSELINMSKNKIVELEEQATAAQLQTQLFIQDKNQEFKQFEEEANAVRLNQLQELEQKLNDKLTVITLRLKNRLEAIKRALQTMIHRIKLAYELEKQELSRQFEINKNTFIEEVNNIRLNIESAYLIKKTAIESEYQQKILISEAEINKLNNWLTENGNMIQNLRGFIPRFKECNEKKNEYLHHKSVLDQIGRDISSLENDKETVENEGRNLDIQTSLFEAKLQQYDKDYIECRLSTVTEVIPGDLLDYEEQKMMLKQAELAITSKQADRSELDKRLDKTNEIRMVYLNQIIGFGNSLEWAIEHYTDEIIVTAEILSEAEQEQTKQERIVKDQNEIHIRSVTLLETARAALTNAHTIYRNAQPNKELFFDYDGEYHINQYRAFHESYFSCIQEKKDAEEGLRMLLAQINALGDAIKRMQKHPFISSGLFAVSPMAIDEWNETEGQPLEVAFRFEDEIRTAQSMLESQKKAVNKAFNNFKSKLHLTNNKMVNAFVGNIDRKLSQEETLFNFALMSTYFKTIGTAVEAKRKQLQIDLEQSNETKEQVVEYCYTRAIDVHKNVKEISKNSRIHLYGKDVEMVVIDWPTVEDSKEAIRKYLDEVIEVLKTKDEGEERRRYSKESLSTRNLVDKVAPLDGCSITVFKPRNEGIITAKGEDYERWDLVHKWSGGEKYAVYMTMFMIIVNYVRKQADGRFSVMKTIVADNPFGKASSGHILKPIFEIAKKNQVKLICFTAHRAEEILRNFPTCYSIKGRNVYGKAVMIASKLEVAYVKK